MKIWDKGEQISKQAISYTVGNDHILDLDLIKYDCIASEAHAKMLHKIDILNDEELGKILTCLDEIKSKSAKAELMIPLEVEDCHSYIENYLIQKIGDVGKKIHTARSRNDQVLTALRLFEKDSLLNLIDFINDFKKCLEIKQEEYEGVPLAGYTHMRKAMPSSIEMWLGSFIESLEDDAKSAESVLSMIDKSPLGTAAGFGVPVFEVDREFTCKELGFSSLIKNPMYAQMSRGKYESTIIHLCSQIMFTMNKLSTDLILFSMGEFAFIELPKDQCTGSSIMPQKSNPDVLEIIRGKYHEVLGEEFKVKSLMANLMSGYNRDIQLSKAPLMNSLKICKESLTIFLHFMKNVEFNESACQKGMSCELYATEKVNKLVNEGYSFREAYKVVAKDF